MHRGLTGDPGIVEEAEKEECIIKCRADILGACSLETNRCIQATCLCVDIPSDKVICSVVSQCTAIRILVQRRSR